MIARILSGVIGGFFVAFFGYMVLSSPLNEPYVSIFMIIWALSIFYSYKAETAGVVWRFLLLTSSVLCFLMPLASFIWSGHQVASTESAGAIIGGGLITMISTFFGFFLGIVFLIIGLLVGKKKSK